MIQKLYDLDEWTNRDGFLVKKKILKITTSGLISGGFLVMKYHCVAAAVGRRRTAAAASTK